jgi:hypothetical protein
LDLFDLEETVFDKCLLALGGDDLGRLQFDGSNLGIGLLKSSVDHVLLGEEVLGEILDSSVTIVRVETGVLSDLVHKTFVFSLLGAEAGHSTKLRDQIDQLVIGVLLDNEERLVGILNLDVVVLLIVVQEGLVGVLDVVLWRLLHINGVDSIDSVVTVVSEHGATNDLFLEELLNVDSLPSVPTALSGLVEELLHLVVDRVVPEDSAREVDQHLDLHAVIDVDGGLVAGPDVEVGLTDLVLEICGLLVKLSVGADFEELFIVKQVLHHNIQKLEGLVLVDGKICTVEV